MTVQVDLDTGTAIFTCKVIGNKRILPN